MEQCPYDGQPLYRTHIHGGVHVTPQPVRPPPRSYVIPSRSTVKGKRLPARPQDVRDPRGLAAAVFALHWFFPEYVVIQ